MKVRKNTISNVKNIKGLINGSFTVEATIIIPMIFFLIFALFYLGFYLYDLNRIQGVVDNTLNKAGLMIKNEADLSNGDIHYDKIKERPVFTFLSQNTAELEDNIRNYIDSGLNSGLFIMDITHKEVAIADGKIKITIVAKSKISLGGVLNFFKAARQETYESSYTIYNAADFIRKAEIALDTGSRIKGLDKLKENLEKIFR
ncbi:MAG: pilus assembly protein [Clostridiales bacterium]|nr:pilus assembly protein [Clostridiales bacterium]